jgi:hypothetical protein
MAHVYATNGKGPVYIYTATSQQVTSPPVVSGLPTWSGVKSVGQTLTIFEGYWFGNPAPTFSFQWYRCASVSECSLIPGATGSTYVLVSEDVGMYMRALYTATNIYGSATDRVSGGGWNMISN